MLRDLLTSLGTREFAMLATLAALTLSLSIAAVSAWRMRRLTRRLARAKAAIENAEAKYALLLETTYDGVLLVPLDGGNIILGNHRAAELTGYDVSELGHMRADRLFPPKGAENWLESAMVMGKGNFVAVDLVRKTGEIASVDVDAVSLRHAGRMALQLTFRPSRSSPESRRARTAETKPAIAIPPDQVPPPLMRMIQEAVERGRTALTMEIAAIVISPTPGGPLSLWLRRNVPAGLLPLNPPARWLSELGEATDQQNGPVVWLAGAEGWSEALDALVIEGIRMMTASPLRAGHRRCGLLLLGSHLSHLMSPREWEVLNQVAQEVARLTELALQFMRLTEAVEELADSERLYRHLLDSAPQALLAVDRAGRLTFCNAAGREIFYLSAQAAMGRTLDELTGGEGVLAHLLRQAMEKGATPTRHRIRLTVRTGEPLAAEIIIVPSTDSEGNTTGAAIALTPIRRSIIEEGAW